MEIDRKELKAQAKQALALSHPRYWAVTLVYLLMTTGVSVLLSLLPLPLGADGQSGSVSLFLSILFSLYTAVLNFGFVLWALWTSRRLNPGLSSLAQGFSVAGRVVLMKILIFARLFLWISLLSLAVSLLAVLFLPLYLLLMSLGPFWIAAGMYGLIYAGMWIIMLRYALSSYLLADHPDDGPDAAIRRSVQLMRGWKMELFKLQLSFLGWLIPLFLLTALAQAGVLWYFGFFQMPPPSTLEEAMSLVMQYASITAHPLTSLATALLTLPVTLFLTPYRSVALAGFYDARLRAPQNADRPMMPPV